MPLSTSPSTFVSTEKNMSSTTWIILAASIFWIAFCYFFLFRRKENSVASSSTRTPEEVIAFYQPLISDISSQPKSEFTNSVLDSENNLVAETLEVANTQPLAQDQNIKDEDLIDIRTLSLNLTNEN
jgi:hypothetical protein